MASTTVRDGSHVHEGKVRSWLSKVFKLNPAALHWSRGVVVLDVTLIPLVVFWAIGHEEYLLSAVLGVLFTALADPGGAFATRALRTAVFALIGAGLTALAFGIGGDAWGWLVLATFVVTLVSGLAIMFGIHRFVAGLLLNAWFIVALSLAASFHHHAHVTSYIWAQVLAWTGGAALWIAVTFIMWLVGGRRDQPPLVAELPGDTSRHELTRPVILFAVIRAIVMAAAVAIAFGANLSHGYWLPIAAMVAMQPSLEQTVLVGVERLAGALIGAAAASLLMLIPANEHGLHLLSITHGLEVVAIVLVMHGAAVRFWNYTLYTAVIAAAALILVDLPQPANFGAEGDRVLWTLCGVGLAVVVMLLAGLLAKRAPSAKAKQPVPAGHAG